MEEKQDLISKLVAEKKSLSEENKAQEEMLHKSRLKNIDYDGKLADLNTKMQCKQIYKFSDMEFCHISKFL